MELLLAETKTFWLVMVAQAPVALLELVSILTVPVVPSISAAEDAIALVSLTARDVLRGLVSEFNEPIGEVGLVAVVLSGALSGGVSSHLVVIEVSVFVALGFVIFSGGTIASMSAATQMASGRPRTL